MNTGAPEARAEIAANMETLRDVIASGTWENVRRAAMTNLTRQTELLVLLELADKLPVGGSGTDTEILGQVQKLLKP